MKNLDEILEGVTAGGQWESDRNGIVADDFLLAQFEHEDGPADIDAAYAAWAARHAPALVRALESHLRSSEEFSRHAMYPHPDCSEQKKLEFIRADIKMKESSRQAHATLAEALKD